ncbi:hypothetical protein DI53_3371 [Sphingobacterium deserti]|uniref:Uncharacterized protein n=1 Tax=Sphingobacterium deserti TaxID=1229276 RepID=A0A0B8T5J8_9SPHI|nr:hypothetical protein DI53_3371 [Sphingobacterium deserti]
MYSDTSASEAVGILDLASVSICYTARQTLYKNQSRRQYLHRKITKKYSYRLECENPYLQFGESQRNKVSNFKEKPYPRRLSYFFKKNMRIAESSKAAKMPMDTIRYNAAPIPACGSALFATCCIVLARWYITPRFPKSIRIKNTTERCVLTHTHRMGVYTTRVIKSIRQINPLFDI